MTGAFHNRLKKNVQQLRPWAAQQKTTAWRAYDQDIPDVRYSVDVYGEDVYLVEFRRMDGSDRQRAEVLAAVEEVLGVPQERIHTRTREPKPWGRAQYEKLASTGKRLEVAEHGLRFLCNLTDYLDTGLFLDHRVTRGMVRKEAAGKRFLNLFSYTGAFTVHAAAGGAASSLSVDMSNTYLDWLEDNLSLNGLSLEDHQTLQADVLEWLQQAKGAFDLIVMDPPSFSASKRMDKTLDVQRDQAVLLQGARRLLAPGGVLYFSTNFQNFVLDTRLLDGTQARELTPKSLPRDFRNERIHRCWRIQVP